MLDTDWLIDLFSPFGTPTVRRMFGGQAILLDGLMVALVAGDVLYLKTDAETVGAFEAAGLDPFAYVAKSKGRVVMPYRRVPAAALDDPDEMRPWVELARAAAVRSAARRKPSSRRSSPRAPAARKS